MSEGGHRVKLGLASFYIVHAPVYIGDQPPPDRVVTVRGSDATATACSEAADGHRNCPALTFFTCPNHLMEELWLVVIPRVVKMTSGQHPALAENWPGLAALAFMLEMIEPRFGCGAQALLHIEPAGAPPGKEVWCLGAARRPPVCAWINLDERPQRALVAVGSETVSKPLVSEAEIQIGGGEGCVWDTASLRVSTPAESGPEQAVRLLILAVSG